MKVTLNPACLAILLWLVALPFPADSQGDLKAKLAATEAARDAAIQRELALEAVIQKLSSSATTTAVKDASQKATQSAITAQDASSANIQAIKESAEAASRSADVARTQAEQLQTVLTSNYRSTVAIQITTVALFTLGFLGTWLVALRDRKWAQADALVKERSTNKLLEQGKQIHTLVNSNMTIAKTKELTALKSNLVLLQAEQTRNPSEAALGIIIELKQEIAELEAQLEDRLKQATLVEKEAAESAAAEGHEGDK